jgi:hypothetical protein
MEALKIPKTDDTPEIVFDKARGVFEISGRSLPEDSVDFYSPVFNWLRQYSQSPNDTTEFSFKLEYTNTASSKMVQDILSVLEKIKGTRIVWYYYESDEDMGDMGHELSELVEIPFAFKTY